MRIDNQGETVLNKILYFTIIYSLFFFSLCVAQTIKEKTKQDIFETEIKTKQQLPLIDLSQGPALENTVDPNQYYVGPSDKLSINIWISPPVNFVLNVTPEGTLIIPTVGEVKISDTTLAEAKQIIIKEIKKKYFATDITVTLINPRPIVITITGNVLNPGSYTLTAVDRADKAIQIANKLDIKQTEDELVVIEKNMSKRNISLKRRDGTVMRVDIIKFLATKDDKYNPYLREGDVIIVPRKNPNKNVFGVYGEVNLPGRFEYIEGDDILDAIQIAHGFTPLANLDSIEFSRLERDAKNIVTKFYSFEEIKKTDSQNLAIEPGDRIIVKSKLELREDFRVFVDGEVKYPGTYPITKYQSRLSEIIKQAGGFTEFASLKTAEVYRRSVSERDIELEKILSMRGSISPDDSASYQIETALRIQKEIVNVDFEKLFLNNDQSQDIFLNDGDYIFIPSVKKTIYVFGQIISPGHIPYIKSQTAEYYISKCGGYTEAARKGDIKIIKAKTKQWLNPSETTIEEGDYIWVPKKVDRTFAYYTTVLSQAASFMSVIVGITVLILQVTK